MRRNVGHFNQDGVKITPAKRPPFGGCPSAAWIGQLSVGLLQGTDSR